MGSSLRGRVGKTKTLKRKLAFHNFVLKSHRPGQLVHLNLGNERRSFLSFFRAPPLIRAILPPRADRVCLHPKATSRARLDSTVPDLSLFPYPPSHFVLARVFCFSLPPPPKDGAVFLAKYLEHQSASMIRDIRGRQSGRESGRQSCRQSRSPERRRRRGGGEECAMSGDSGHDKDNDNDDGSNSSDQTDGGTNTDDNSSSSSSSSQPIRVLELGCGTGLAGLAAALSLGRPIPTDNDGTLPLPSQDPDSPTRLAQRGTPPPSPLPTAGVEVVLTDLPYALTNARANISRNDSALEAAGASVVATELDWCRSLPTGLRGEHSVEAAAAAADEESRAGGGEALICCLP